MKVKATSEILSALKKWAIERHDYFAELRRKNLQAKSVENVCFDMGEMDFASCVIDKIEALCKQYGVEVEE